MRKQYSKKEIKHFLEVHPYASEYIDKKNSVVEDDGRLIVDDKVLYRKYEETWIPSLEFLREHSVLPKVVVDKGTPPFIAKGADLMRPGVVSCEDFSAGDVVVLVDEVHSFPLATGRALYSSDDLMALKEGKVVKILFNLQS